MPLPFPSPRDTSYEKRVTINVINEVFAFKGESCGTREVYVANMSKEVTHPRPTMYIERHHVLHGKGHGT